MRQQRTHEVGGRGGRKSPPRSPSYEGRFGRMFRKLAPAAVDPGRLDEIAQAMREQTTDGWSGPALRPDNDRIPAAYTYLGQFIDHDVTFDPASSLQRENDPDALVNFRSPRLDLDSMYGRGPDDEPYLYDRESPGSLRLLVGAVRDDAGNPTAEPDLQRNRQGRAVIGDPRNDENTIVSQLHLAMVMFHNRVCDEYLQQHGLGHGMTDLQRRATQHDVQRRVRWHYQWVVAHDYLKRTVGEETHARLLPGAGGDAKRRHYRVRDNAYLPVEFSVAAFRFGHSQVRERYDLNAAVTDKPVFATGDKAGPLDDLRGFRELPGQWSIDWSRFAPLAGGPLQNSRPIDTMLSPTLFDLPGEDPTDALAQSLPARNLRRGATFGLPSGQDVARAIGTEPLTDADLGIGGGPAPLWFYVLKEAEVVAGGAHLGPVGGTIVGETLLGLLEADPLSYLSVQRDWTPDLPPAPGREKFDLAGLLSHAAGASTDGP